MKQKIKQHYRNGRNWGDGWFFITKMMLQGNLLTDDKYNYYLMSKFGSLYAITGVVQPDDCNGKSETYTTGETK